MNETTARLLEGLAQKLGTTSEYLWGVLVAGQSMKAVVATIYVLIGISIFVVALHYLRSTVTRFDEFSDEVLPVITIVACGIVMIVGFVAVTVSLADAIYGFFRPEYAALHELLSTLGGGK